jgi:hypothetical protein
LPTYNEFIYFFIIVALTGMREEMKSPNEDTHVEEMNSLEGGMDVNA